MYETLNRYQTEAPNRFTTVTVAASGGDYTSIKAAVAAASPAALAPVKIYVRNGTYNEIQIDGKDYLTIEGESRAGVVMVSDGLRTDVDPVSGQRYVDMVQANKHGFKINHTMTIRNMTIQVNDVKYCIHSDNSGAYTLQLENVRMQHSNGFPLGVGAWASQLITATNCVFEKTGDNEANGTQGSHGIYWHNWNNQAAACRLELSDCDFINCGLVELYELGSAQTDLVQAKNCETDGAKGFYFVVTNTYYNAGGVPIIDIPYCINLLTIGGSFPETIDYNAGERPNLLDHVSVE